MTDEEIEKIFDLIDDEKFEEIYNKYGAKIYRFVVTNKYRKKDIKRLIDEGKFEEIYTKYGKIKYNDKLPKMQEKEIINETGSKVKGFFGKTKSTLRYIILPYVLTAGISIPTVVIGLDTERGLEKYINSVEYAKQIEHYNKKIEQYAKEIKAMNLTDIQLFMKLMKDLWNEIDGYKFPEKEITGFLRVTLDEEGVGVCRNFADDLTAKLNLINPKYNARNIVVFMEDGKYKIANIKRNIIKDDKTVVGQEGISKLDFNDIPGNHMVTAVDIKEKNITLVLDPTNPGIGVFRDGKIYLFSRKDRKGIETRQFHQLVYEGLESAANVEWTEIKSFFSSKYSLEELEKLYGIEAQNKALEELEEIEDEIRRDSFVKKLRVGTEQYLKPIQKNNKIHNKEEIEK